MWSNRTRRARNAATYRLTLTGDKLTSKNLTENFGKEKNRLSPTDIGMVVNDYLETQFKPIMDYNFTANVEKEFDRVADGDITWDTMIHDFYGPFHQMVDTAIGTQTDKKSQARILGNDPKTGHVVKARIGRYGPMVEIEGNEGEKGRFASLKKGRLIESITLEEALEAFRPAPRPRRAGGRAGSRSASANTGPTCATASRSPRFRKATTPTRSPTSAPWRSCAPSRLPQPRPTLRCAGFPEDPDMLVKNGRYGPYIAYKGKNYRLPKGAKPETLTLEECRKIVSSSKK